MVLRSRMGSYSMILIDKLNAGIASKSVSSKWIVAYWTQPIQESHADCILLGLIQAVHSVPNFDAKWTPSHDYWQLQQVL